MVYVVDRVISFRSTLLISFDSCVASPEITGATRPLFNSRVDIIPQGHEVLSATRNEFDFLFTQLRNFSRQFSASEVTKAQLAALVGAPGK